MAARMKLYVLETTAGEPGISLAVALLVPLLFLILLGLLTAFAKDIRIIAREKREEAATSFEAGGRIFQRLLEEPDRLHRRLSLSRILAGLAGLSWSATLAIPRLVSWTGVDHPPASSCLAVAFFILFVFVLLLFGLVLPERAAGRRAGIFVRYSWYFLAPSIFLATAIDLLLYVTSSLILKILGLRDLEVPEPAPTEEEFLQMLEAGHAVGAIEDDNRELIANLFEFDDKIAGEIMTHRTEIEALPASAGIEETMSFLYDTKYTRFPVYEGSVDNIVGILHVKDLLFYREQTRGDEVFSLTKIMRPAWFTPETRNISDLFREMQQNHIQMAIVIDEYGGTAGLLTIEDLIEQIVGNIEDEYDEVEQELIEIAPGNWLVEGSYPLDRLARVTGIPIDDDEYDTVAGLVIDLLDRIPEEHERPVVHYGPLTFRVLAISDNRIVRIRVTRADLTAGMEYDR